MKMRTLASRMLSGFARAVEDLLTIRRRDPRTRRFGLGVFAVVAVLICVPFTWELLLERGAPVRPLPRPLKVTADGGIPEIVSGTMAATCAWLLYRIWRLSGVRLFGALVLVFSFVVLDDTLKYHENVGDVLAERLGLPPAFGLAPDDLGEMLAWGLAGAVLAVPVLLSMAQRTRNAHGFAGVFLFCIGALAFFGIGVDAVASASHAWLLGYVEDGGEMLAVALALVSAFALYRGYTVPGLAASVRLAAADPPRV